MQYKTRIITLGRWIARGVAALLIGWIAGFGLFCGYIRSMPVPSSTHLTQGIAVFTGDHLRIQTAIALLSAQVPQPLLHLSGLYRTEAATHHRSADRALNTTENVLFTGQWLRKHGLRSIRLVTSDYHMPRSLILAHALWPRDVKILPHPIHLKTRHYLQKLWVEYNKWIATVFRIWLPYSWGKWMSK